MRTMGATAMKDNPVYLFMGNMVFKLDEAQITDFRKRVYTLGKRTPINVPHIEVTIKMTVPAISTDMLIGKDVKVPKNPSAEQLRALIDAINL